jgi:hypothetical protein
MTKLETAKHYWWSGDKDKAVAIIRNFKHRILEEDITAMQVYHEMSQSTFWEKTYNGMGFEIKDMQTKAYRAVEEFLKSKE